MLLQWKWSLHWPLNVTLGKPDASKSSGLITFTKKRAWISSIRYMFRFSTHSQISNDNIFFGFWHIYKRVKRCMCSVLRTFKQRSKITLSSFWTTRKKVTTTYNDIFSYLNIPCPTPCIDKKWVRVEFTWTFMWTYEVHLDDILCRNNERNKWISKKMLFSPAALQAAVA